ncbi:MAG: dihydrofolate reductase [Chitinophagaceae bacterium]|nr:MAG: dihydrofolate reductase [Chitinophagaceae bacterium]
MNNLSIIVAISENNAIGKDNQLLWHLPADLKHFKEITTGHTIIMGRKTYDSIGKPLPNRRSIVITRNPNLAIEGVEVVTSLAAAIELCKQDEEAFIIGGAEIYQQAVPLSSRVHLTRIHQYYDADAFFPILNPTEWKEINSITYPADDKNNVAYTFSTLERVEDKSKN